MKRTPFLLLSLSLATVGSAQERRSVTFEDVLALESVGAPAMAPDGSAVLYTVTGWEEREDGEMASVSHVWRAGTDGGDEVQLTFGEKGERSPRWSPDGTFISFVAARGEGEDAKSQIWLMRTAGGEAFELTDAKEGVEEYAWSPDGSTIAFVTRDPPSDEDEKKRKRRDDARVYEGDVRMDHLWTVGISSREAAQRTSGTAYTVRGRPSWSPAGDRIAFAAAPTRWLRDSREDVYVVDLADDSVEKIAGEPGREESPASRSKGCC